ncbi:MAG: hypothetical protein JST22_10665 [Bacteroidetes bacterium]|nr:hypothetical protein [Bacteroidota bacterium]
MRAFLVAIVVIAALASAAAIAQPQKRTVTVQVLDSLGHRIPNSGLQITAGSYYARLPVVHRPDSLLDVTVYSDGVYDVTCTAAGYLEFRGHAHIGPATPAQFTIQMAKVPTDGFGYMYVPAGSEPCGFRSSDSLVLLELPHYPEPGLPVECRLYRVSGPAPITDFVRGASNYQHPQLLREWLKEHRGSWTDDAHWTVTPATPYYYLTHVPVRTRTPGCYLVEMNYGTWTDWSLLLINDIDLAVESSRGICRIIAVDAATGKRLGNVPIAVTSPGRTDSTTTGPDGIAEVTIPSLQSGISSGNQPPLVTAYRNGSFACVTAPPVRELAGQGIVAAWTDRSLYMPGDTVHVVAVARQRDTGGRIRMSSTKRVYADVHATYSSDGLPPVRVYRDSLQPGKHGELHCDLVIPRNAPPGTYEAQVESDSGNQYAPVRVASNTRAGCITDLEPSRQWYVRGDTIAIDVSARERDGSPASLATFGYIFGLERLEWEHDGSFAFGAVPLQAYGMPTAIGSGNATTDTNGRFTILIPTVQEGERDYVLHCSLLPEIRTADGGAPLCDVFVTRCGIGIDMEPNRRFARVGEQVLLSLRLADLTGEGTSGHPCSVTIYRLDPAHAGDTARAHRSAIWSTTVHCDSSGMATVLCPVETEGSLEIVVGTMDTAGHTTSRSAMLIGLPASGGPGSHARARGPEVRQYADQPRIIAEKYRYAPDDTVRLLILHPREDADAYLTEIAAQPARRMLARVEHGFAIVTLPLLPANSPRTTVALNAWHHGTMCTDSTQFDVANQPAGLRLTLATDSTSYTAGGYCRAGITVTDPLGNPVPGVAITAWLTRNDPAVAPETMRPRLEPTRGGAAPIPYLRSASQTFDYRAYLQTGMPATAVPRVWTLQQQRISREPEPRMFAFDGASNARSFHETIVHRNAASPVLPRSRTIGTVWYDSLITDDRGAAHALIRLPNDDATWSLAAVGFGGEYQLATDARIIRSVQPLTVRYSGPTHLAPGDTAAFAAVAGNRSSTQRSATVHLATSTGRHLDSTMIIPPFGARAVALRLAVTTEDTIRVSLRAASAGITDSESTAIPVATSKGHVAESRELITNAAALHAETGLRVRASCTGPRTLRLILRPSLAGSLLGRLDSLIKGCNTFNNVPHMMLMCALATEALGALPPFTLPDTLRARLPRLIDSTIALLAGTQRPSGEWWAGSYSGREGISWTAITLYALLRARQAGHDVPPETIARAHDRLIAILDSNARLAGSIPKDSLLRPGVEAIAILAAARSGTDRNPMLAERIKALTEENRLPNNSAAALALAAHSLGETALAERIATQVALNGYSIGTARLISIADGDQPGNGAPVTWSSSGAMRDMWGYGGDADTRGMVLETLLTIGVEQPIMHRGALNLMKVNKFNYWRTDYGNALVGLALARYLRTYALPLSNVATVRLNGDIVYERHLDSPADLMRPDTSVLLAAPLKVGENSITIDATGGPGVDATVMWEYETNDFGGDSTNSGIHVDRSIFKLSPRSISGTRVYHAEPPDSIRPGDLLLVRVRMLSREPVEGATLSLPLPGGCVPDGETSIGQIDRRTYPDSSDNSRILFQSAAPITFSGLEGSVVLPVGTKSWSLQYEYGTVVRATTPGTFRVLPAVVSGRNPIQYGSSGTMTLAIGEPASP